MSEYGSITKSFAEGNVRDELRQRSSLEHGTRTDLPIFYRYVILDVIADPSIIDKTKLDYWENDLGVSNIQHAQFAPRNSIIAKRAQNNNTTIVEQTMVLYPFLPSHISLPSKPGEHVWVMFEDPSGTKNDIGYWMWRITEPSFVEDVNHTHHHRAHDPSFIAGTRDKFEGSSTAKYEFRNGSIGDVDGQRYAIAESATLPNEGENAYQNLMTESDASKLVHLEAVPRFKKRPGDVVLEGSNNSLIVLGRDRIGAHATYKNEPQRGQIPEIPTDDNQDDGSGTIDIVVGRGQTSSTAGSIVKNSLDKNEIAKDSENLEQNEGDPDLKNDRSRVLLSQKTRVDKNLELDSFNATEFSISDDQNGEGCVVIKSDKLRLIARSDVELLVKGNERDNAGRLIDSNDTSNWAAIVIKSNGDIVFRPSTNGVIKLGADDADKALVCTDLPAINNAGQVRQAGPLITTMGGQLLTNVTGQGAVATKVLVK